MKAAEKAAWLAVIVLALIGSGAAIHRAIITGAGAVEMHQPGFSDKVDIRYNLSPRLTLLHVIPALAFMTAP